MKSAQSLSWSRARATRRIRRGGPDRPIWRYSSASAAIWSAPQRVGPHARGHTRAAPRASSRFAAISFACAAFVMRCGAASLMCPKNARRTGSFSTRSVSDNSAVAALARFTRVASACSTAERCGLQPSETSGSTSAHLGLDAEAGRLSGGNQQKLMLGAERADFDEPLLVGSFMTKRLVHLGISNFDAGKAGAAMLADAIGHKGKVLLGTFPAPPVLQRVEGYKAYFKCVGQVVDVINDKAIPHTLPLPTARA